VSRRANSEFLRERKWIWRLREIRQAAGGRRSNHGHPVRGRSHAMTISCGDRRLRGKPCRCSAAFAKAFACGLDCRFSAANDIHSRMMVRRVLDLAM
jgi:hypothetical protein